MKTIFKNNEQKGGVYKIVNKYNNKIYIGSTNNFKRRATTHISLLLKNKHHNKHLQNSFNKYGDKAFVFMVAEAVEGEKLSRTTCEQKYINEYLNKWDMCYNVDKKVICEEGPWSYTPEETRKKMSENMIERWKDPKYKKNHSEKIKEKWRDPTYKKNLSDKTSIMTKEQWNNPKTREIIIEAVRKSSKNRIGKSWGKHTTEHKNKISKLMKGNSWNKGRKHSKEFCEFQKKELAKYKKSKKRIKNLRKKLCKPVVGWKNEDPNTKYYFSSIVEASEITKLSRYVIRKILKCNNSRTAWNFLSL